MVPEKMPYQLEKWLGQGTSATVFLASRVDEVSGARQQVAIKFLNSEKLVEAWRQELQSLQQVDSPYCLRLLGFERFSGKPAIILEYVEGLSLRQLAEWGPLSEDLMVEIIAQAQQGLKDLNQRGLNHGDLSPANMMINTSGQVKLLDFGLANSSPQGRQFTPPFAAPEVLYGEPHNLYADYFSLGLVMSFLGFSQKKLTGLLHPEPHRRTGLASESCQELRQVLGELVKSRMQELADREAKTKVQEQQRSHPYYAFGVLTSIIYIFLVMVPGSQSWSMVVPGEGQARLSVYTNEWTEVYLDGQRLGYSPIKNLAIKPGAHRLNWNRKNNSGESTLTILPEESLVLGDQDFVGF